MNVTAKRTKPRTDPFNKVGNTNRYSERYERSRTNGEMRNSWTVALGDPQVFLSEIELLADQFKSIAQVENAGIPEIRHFIKSGNYELTKNPQMLRILVAAFSSILVKRFSQTLHIRGILRRRITVESTRFRCDLLDLFYRCAFEGLELD
jgi:hypothetical protein